MTALLDRTTYLGGTDIAAIAGVSPYRDVFRTWREKTSEAEPWERTRRMRMGQLLEHAGAVAYSEVTERRLRRFHRTLVHPQYPFLGGNPDRSIVGARGLVEVKASMRSEGYGEPGTDQVPAHVAVQCQWYLGLTGRDFVDVALLLGTAGVDIYPITRSDDLIEGLVELGVNFWREHVEARVPPAIDGSDGARAELARRFPRETEGELVATAEQILLVDQLRAARQARRAAEAQEQELENQILEAMGGHSALLGPGFRITWTRTAGSVRWKAVAEELGRFVDPMLWGVTVGKHTGDPSRRFTPVWKERRAA